MKVGFLFICVACVFRRRTTDALVHFIITPKSQIRVQEGSNATIWWDYISDETLTFAQWGTVNEDDNFESIIAQQGSSGDIKYISTNFKDRAFIEGRATLHLLNVKVSDSGRYGCEIFFQGESSPTLKNVTELIVSEGATAAPLTPGGRIGDNNSNIQPVYIALVIVMVIFIVLVLVYLYTTRTQRATLIDKSNSQVFGPSVELNNMNQGEPYENAELRQSPTKETLDSSLRDYSVIPPITPSQVKKDWEIPRDSLVFVKVIGNGAFGQVAKGMAQGIRDSKENQLVAIKMLRKNSTDENRQNLLSELNMMKKLEQHHNVIELLGCVTKSDPVMVITEYAPYGDLLGFLRKSRGLHDTYYDDPDIKPLSSLNTKQLFGFASDIANGMKFLSSKKIVHRDLAARNVLVGEEEICKITDFGMAKDVFKEDLYRRTTTGRLPVKWTALESLVYGICTTMSDIWSYGIVMYEIFTIGGSPYPKVEGTSLASLLQEGYRMPKPPHLDEKLYDVMVSCWNETPEKRPTFAELRKTMEQMQNQKEIYVNLKSYDAALYQIADEQNA